MAPSPPFAFSAFVISATAAAPQTTVATTDASAPKSPPESHAGPCSSPRRSPVSRNPDTATPKIAPCVKFHAAWSPIASHSRRVTRYAAARRVPASTAIESALQTVACGLPMWARPKSADEITSAAHVPSHSSRTRNRIPRATISSTTPDSTAIAIEPRTTETGSVPLTE